MSSPLDVVEIGKTKLPLLAVGFFGVLLTIALSMPNLFRAKMSANDASGIARRRQAEGLLTSTYLQSPLVKTKSLATISHASEATEGQAGPNAASGRRIIRTVSIEMVVHHPSEISNRIAVVAEDLGGYVMSADNGDLNARTAKLMIRVPAVHLEQARMSIRELGLRVESEKIEAEDVTDRYVDQDATLRNLRAEEAQYLGILKQARSVKDMLAVSEKLSEVRGQIEQRQAEFNALSQQIETVAMTISLRTEAEAQVFGLDWRPGYQIKLALRDGLESVANYAATMTAILFYLPAALLWAATILIVLIAGFRTVNWVGRRWFGWRAAQASVQS